MSQGNLSLSLIVGALFAGGSYLLLQRGLLRIVVGFVLLGHGANLTLLLSGGPAKHVPEAGTSTPTDASDPLPQAMALTAVVITFAVTALLLALTDRSVRLYREDGVQDDVEDRRLGGRQPDAEWP
ncbi:sodium:proton antiporter [Plantactinospora sp. CA-294935]|uniref:sodium:proton antiporter n=1 Tax=Plantactinospora sp. CA-294935 TaxID=3240012 RepID=UPI003D939C00